MINREKIHLELLTQLSNASETLLQAELKNILKEHGKLIIENAESIAKTIDQGMKIYRGLQEKGLVGDICFLYFSFLFTGVLENKIKYRIDFYDENDRVSDIECFINWEFLEFSTCLNKIHKYLEDEFNTRGKEWSFEVDSILYTTALSLRSLSDHLLVKIWEEILTRKSWEWYSREKVKIMVGELFDEAKLII